MAQATTISDNKRIAKNTVYLYIRMFVTLIVTLYTSRVIIKTLGIDDFGIYSIVGGIVVLFSFISTSLRSSTQRFVSYELGLGEKGDVNKVYSVSMLCHIVMALIFFVLAETIGLWYVENKLNVPLDRVEATQWVYQFCILTFIANIFQAPYNAIIIAYEKMCFYAYISIIEVVLKLAVAFLIVISPGDKLIVYSILLSIVSIICVLIPYVYCKWKLRIGRIKILYERKLFANIMCYSGWTMLSGCAVVVTQQGGNILLNLFYSVAANGAFGIANQVSSAIYGFVYNFQSAFQPQIVKQYAAQENDGLYKLVGRASIFSFYLLLLIAVPFCISTDYILELWLDSCPEYAAVFCQLMILYFLMDALQAPLWMLIGAKGKVGGYITWSTILFLLNLPISWFLLKAGYPAYVVFIIRVAINFLTCIIRPFYVRYLINTFPLRQYGVVTLRALIVTSALVITYLLTKDMANDMNDLLKICFSFLYSVLVIWVIGLKKDEKNWIKQIVLEKIKR
ncbi:Membrane protein involved in the export of O-antigen and teichoic acid [Prevotellaceae bacterium MN60]|nr:Membrane protein involved in the export of O-antigen and teichoic acid [Prevotellaceae bacterium MN60]